jgi:hypothetical protein
MYVHTPTRVNIMGKTYKKQEEKATEKMDMRVSRKDLACMDFIAAKFGLISRAASVRFALNWTSKNARELPVQGGR